MKKTYPPSELLIKNRSFQRTLQIVILFYIIAFILMITYIGLYSYSVQLQKYQVKQGITPVTPFQKPDGVFVKVSISFSVISIVLTGVLLVYYLSKYNLKFSYTQFTLIMFILFGIVIISIDYIFYNKFETACPSNYVLKDNECNTLEPFETRPKILLVGLPKSGTTSFQHLFETLGMRSYHHDYRNRSIGVIMKNNKKNKKKLLDGIEDWDCITQMDVCQSFYKNYWPQVSDLKQLYEENKDCVFILNRRDPEKMLSSWKRWKKYDKRFYLFNPELIEEKNDQGLVKWFIKHFDNVEKFFATKPNVKFISFDIEKDSIKKLKKYIDIKGITEFPKKNQNLKNRNIKS